MTTITSPSVGRPPAPEPRVEEHAASTTGVARDRLVHQVGYWAATVTAACALG